MTITDRPTAAAVTTPAAPAGWPAPTTPTDRYDALLMSERWLEAFTAARDARPEIPWDDELSVAPFPRRALLRSLATFQLGESGEGTHLRRRAERQSHPSYADAIDLFVADEQDHARLLAEVLRRLGGELRTSHWSDAVFVAVRHVAGLRTELLVLMAAELIALAYYGLLARSADSPVLRAVTGRILADELRHVGFHCDHLAWGIGAWPAPLRRVTALGWRRFLTVVAWTVAWDHRAVIRAGGSTVRGFVAECERGFDEASRRIFG